VSAEVPCPQCGTPLVKGSSSFCSNCGYYLQWTETPEEPEAEPVSTRRPKEAVEPAGEDPPPAAPPAEQASPPPVEPATIASGPVCPSCGVENPPQRTLCIECGAALAPTFERPPPPPTVSSKPRLPVMVGAGVAVLALIALVAFFAVRGEPAAPEAAPADAAVRVAPGGIAASASNELPPSQGLSYGAGNTLDGDLATAWNDGAAGPGVGETLSFRFERPVDLTEISMVNGYAKSEDTFQQNARIREARVITDAGSFPLTLADSAARQEVERDFGQTSSVTLEIVSVYPGTTYDDLALTEIEFFARPES